jgi:hypothetical protein
MNKCVFSQGINNYTDQFNIKDYEILYEFSYKEGYGLNTFYLYKNGSDICIHEHFEVSEDELLVPINRKFTREEKQLSYDIRHKCFWFNIDSKTAIKIFMDRSFGHELKYATEILQSRMVDYLSSIEIYTPFTNNSTKSARKVIHVM